MGILIWLVLNSEVAITGGPDGIQVPRLVLFGWRVAGAETWYWINGLTLLAGVLVALNLEDSPIGRALRALHDSEVAAAVAGIDVARAKLAVFVIAAVYAALAGALLALFNRFVTPQAADFLHSIELVTMVVIGGMGSCLGAVVGAAVLTILPQALTVFHDYEHAVLGLMIILFMIFLRQGDRAGPRGAACEAAGMSAIAAQEIGISFGGLRALDGVSFSAEPGEVFSIIGPNGAGKTTLFNIISGVYRTREGKVLLAGEDVTGLPPHRLAARGSRARSRTCRSSSA